MAQRVQLDPVPEFVRMHRKGPAADVWADDAAPGTFTYSRWAHDPDGPPASLLWVCVWCGQTHAVPLATYEKGPAPWSRSGPDDAPTLTPSIRVTMLGQSPPCGWHGYVKAGELQTLGDSQPRRVIGSGVHADYATERRV